MNYKNITEIYNERFTIIKKYNKITLQPKFNITDNVTNEEITLELSNADNLTEESIYNIVSKDTLTS